MLFYVKMDFDSLRTSYYPPQVIRGEDSVLLPIDTKDKKGNDQT